MKKTAKNSIIYMTGMIVISVVSFFNTIIMTRILPSHVYAQYGLLTTFTTASVTVISLGMDAAYTRFFYESGYSARRFLLRSVMVPLAVLVVYMIALLEPRHWLLNFIFQDGVTDCFIWFFIIYLLFSLFGKFTQLTARMGEFATNYVLSDFIAKAGFVVIVLAAYLIVTYVSVDMVALSFAIASGFAMFINLYTLKKMDIIQISTHKKVTTMEMMKYGIPTMINNVMILIIPLVNRLIVRDIVGWEVLSKYTAATVFYTVIALMKNTIDNIWRPIVFRHYKNEKVFKAMMHDFGLAITWIATIGLGGVIVLRRWLVLILSSSYHESYIIAPAIMYTAIYDIYNLIYAVGINTAKKTSHLIVAPIVHLVISISLCYILIPTFGLIGIGIASLLSVVISNTYKILLGLHYYGTGQREWKIALLWGTNIAASIFVMYSTQMISDIIVGATLCVVSFIVINTEGIVLIDKINGMVFKKNRK